MNKLCTMQQALEHVKPGRPIMISGFLGVGTPERLIGGLLERGDENIVLIANDGAFPDKGVGRLLAAGRVRDFIACHVGTNTAAGNLWREGEINVELIPQGTLLERIRIAGAGLGGVLTPVGLGTSVEEGKRVITVDGKRFLLEPPLSADVALIKAHKGDPMGNLVYRRTARNYNPVMATAAAVVIAEVDELVGIGDLDPDEIITPGIFVDYVLPPGEGVLPE